MIISVLRSFVVFLGVGSRFWEGTGGWFFVTFSGRRVGGAVAGWFFFARFFVVFFR